MSFTPGQVIVSRWKQSVPFLTKSNSWEVVPRTVGKSTNTKARFCLDTTTYNLCDFKWSYSLLCTQILHILKWGDEKHRASSESCKHSKPIQAKYSEQCMAHGEHRVHVSVTISKYPVILMLGLHFPKKCRSQDMSRVEPGWVLWLPRHIWFSQVVSLNLRASS